jgi:hypothetical protein
MGEGGKQAPLPTITSAGMTSAIVVPFDDQATIAT